MKSLLPYLFTGVSFLLTAQAQDIRSSTIDWNIASTTKLDPFEIFEGSATLTTIKGKSVKWRKADGSVTTFWVNEVLGNWPDVKQAGEITFEVAVDEQRGTITFSRNGQDIKIRILLTREGEPEMYELAVSSCEVQALGK